MAKWKKIKSRGSVDDRRSLGKAEAGMGITGIILLMGVSYLLGGNPLDVLQQVDPTSLMSESQSTQENLAQYEGNDKYEEFVSIVLGSTDDFWNYEFNQIGREYTEPQVVLFRGATQSSCGGAQSASGPHYCPRDQTIYLDETFFTTLKERYGAEGGDVAEAYVLGHEVGHHVQKQLGTLNNSDSVSIELQADCFSGMWAGSLKGKGIFDDGEITEALDAAAAVGDDNIQSRSTGVIQPESWTHGSSADRVSAFNRGFEERSIARCQKF